MNSPIITLITVTQTQNEFGGWTETETERDVFCKARSVSRAEWFNASNNGIKATHTVTMPIENYNGELIAKYEGKRYGIYRTYQDGQNVELYLEEKQGV